MLWYFVTRKNSSHLNMAEVFDIIQINTQMPHKYQFCSSALFALRRSFIIGYMHTYGLYNLRVYIHIYFESCSKFTGYMIALQESKIAVTTFVYTQQFMIFYWNIYVPQTLRSFICFSASLTVLRRNMDVDVDAAKYYLSNNKIEINRGVP